MTVSLKSHPALAESPWGGERSSVGRALASSPAGCMCGFPKGLVRLPGWAAAVAGFRPARGPAVVILMAACMVWWSPRGFAQERGSPHFGVEFGAAYAKLPDVIADSVQDRYSVRSTGWTYAMGLTRFHASGAPSYSLQALLFRLDGEGANLNTGSLYTGNARLAGFMATKCANLLARSHGSFVRLRRRRRTAVQRHVPPDRPVGWNHVS